MAHAQKLDLVFQRNERVHLNWRGRQFSRLLAAEVCASAVVMVVKLDTPCSEVECKTTGYPLHSHVSPSLPLPCVTVCHQVSTELYQSSADYHGCPTTAGLVDVFLDFRQFQGLCNGIHTDCFLSTPRPSVDMTSQHLQRPLTIAITACLGSIPRPIQPLFSSRRTNCKMEAFSHEQQN